MAWIPPYSTIYEYRCLEWRNFEKENIQQKLDQLIADGWELDGPSSVKSGTFVDLNMQQLRRLKTAHDS